MEKGRQEGRREEQLNIARAMRVAGSTLDFIAQVTGLSSADLEALH